MHAVHRKYLFYISSNSEANASEIQEHLKEICMVHGPPIVSKGLHM